jgi:hypothetical protein
MLKVGTASIAYSRLACMAWTGRHLQHAYTHSPAPYQPKHVPVATAHPVIKHSQVFLLHERHVDNSLHLHQTVPNMSAAIVCFSCHQHQQLSQSYTVHQLPAQCTVHGVSRCCVTVWSLFQPPAGGRVWCDGGLYPRKLYVNMVNGQPNWRCACFKELGWSDIRQV